MKNRVRHEPLPPEFQPEQKKTRQTLLDRLSAFGAFGTKNQIIRRRSHGNEEYGGLRSARNQNS